MREPGDAAPAAPIEPSAPIPPPPGLTTAELLRSPTFFGLPAERQLEVLRQVDPQFASFTPEEQQAVLPKLLARSPLAPMHTVVRSDGTVDDASPVYATVAQRYGLPPGLLQAIVHTESSARADTRPSRTGVRGLAQITRQAWKEVAPEIPYTTDPATQIEVAGRILERNLHATGGNLAAAVARYGDPRDRLYAGRVLASLPLYQVQPMSPERLGVLTPEHRQALSVPPAPGLPTPPPITPKDEQRPGFAEEMWSRLYSRPRATLSALLYHFGLSPMTPEQFAEFAKRTGVEEPQGALQTALAVGQVAGAALTAGLAVTAGTTFFLSGGAEATGLIALTATLASLAAGPAVEAVTGSEALGRYTDYAVAGWNLLAGGRGALQRISPRVAPVARRLAGRFTRIENVPASTAAQIGAQLGHDALGPELGGQSLEDLTRQVVKERDSMSALERMRENLKAELAQAKAELAAAGVEPTARGLKAATEVPPEKVVEALGLPGREEVLTPAQRGEVLLERLAPPGAAAPAGFNTVRQQVAQTRRGLYQDFAKKLELLGTTADPQGADLLQAQQAVTELRGEVVAGRVRLSPREEESLKKAEAILSRADPVPLSELHDLHGTLWEVALDPERLATADGEFVGKSFARIRATLSASIEARLRQTTPAVAEDYRQLKEVVANVEAPIRDIGRRIVGKRGATAVEALVSGPFRLTSVTGRFVQDRPQVANLARLLFLSPPPTRRAIVDGYWLDLIDAATDRATGRLDLGELADLWKKVPASIQSFMTAEWHAGAGAKLADLITTHARVREGAARVTEVQKTLKQIERELAPARKAYTQLLNEISRRSGRRVGPGVRGIHRFFLFWQAAGMARGALTGNLGMILYHGATLSLLRFPDLWMTLLDKSADPRLRIIALRTIRGLAVAYAGERASPRPAFADEAETLRLLDRQLGR
jgi:hypothetical protein